MTIMPTILIADDDEKLVAALRRTLAYEGYTVLTATDGRDALAQAQARRPDLVVLDWMMPGLDGVEVARRLRAAAGLPYLVKPFATTELLARVRSLLRRTLPVAGAPVLRYADLTLDPATRETRRGDRAFALSPTEFDLLAYQLRHPRQVLPRAAILEEVWGYDFAGDAGVLDVYIAYLRSKTEAGGEPRLIQTVRGVGYVLRAD